MTGCRLVLAALALALAAGCAPSDETSVDDETPTPAAAPPATPSEQPASSKGAKLNRVEATAPTPYADTSPQLAQGGRLRPPPDPWQPPSGSVPNPGH